MSIEIEKALVVHGGEGVNENFKEALKQKLGGQILIRTSDIAFLETHLEMFNPQLVIFLSSVSNDQIADKNSYLQSFFTLWLGLDTHATKLVSETVPELDRWDPEQFFTPAMQAKVGS